MAPEDVAGEPAPRITVFSYAEDELEEVEVSSASDALAYVRDGRTTWINVDGLGDLAVLEALWDGLNVHPLVREDIVSLRQRPKFEEYADQDFLVLRMFRMDGELTSEQVAIVFGQGWILSFQQGPGDVFDPVRDRVRGGRPRIRTGGSDYLCYCLLDAVVDGFFPVLEEIGAQLEAIEDEIVADPSPDIVERTHRLRRSLVELRRAIWPLREAVSNMQRTETSTVVRRDVRTYLRDVYDHTVRVMDLVESYRELGASLTDMYYTALSHRTNEIMRTLTIVATIFIPLTFLAGIYGMNFQNMPELAWRYGYFVLLGIMALATLLMLGYFRRRRWL